MKKSKNVRMDEWMFEFIEELASQQGVESSVWIREVLATALEKQGLSRAVYYNRRTVRARQASQESLENRSR
jgi:hypothetical protein